MKSLTLRQSLVGLLLAGTMILAGRSFDTRAAGPAAAPANAAGGIDDWNRILAPTTQPGTRPVATRPATIPASQPALLPVTRPAVVVRKVPVEFVTDTEIDRSLARGLDRMIEQFDPVTFKLRGNHPVGSFETGLNALCVFAVLETGRTLNDPRLTPRAALTNGLIDNLKRMNAAGWEETYAYALRACALSVYHRPEDQGALTEDVEKLVSKHINGAYGYGQGQPVFGNPNGLRPGVWDSSNSQYGLLGVWYGAEAGVEVPRDYWQIVERHWERNQSGNAWAYAPAVNVSSTSMRAAGLASLSVARDYLDAGAQDMRVGRPPFTRAQLAALKWWDELDFTPKIFERKTTGYTLFGIERIGRATGLKYFGKTEWYGHLARMLMVDQADDGGFNGNLLDTAYVMLFLARGRHPVMMNKLRFDGDAKLPDFWSNRPRDVAFLSRYAGAKLERPLNWQAVPLARPAKDWMDAPILYIASHKKPHFKPADIDKLREYALAGGLIFTHTDWDEIKGVTLDSGNGEFDRFVAELAKQLFPELPYADVPIDHPIYSAMYKLDHRPALKGVSNGARLLLVHSPADVNHYWQRRNTEFGEGGKAFKLGMNLYAYATGREIVRNRLDTVWLPEPGASTAGTIPLVRLKYAGRWDPEPAAWPRMAKLFQWRTGSALSISNLKLDELKPGVAPIAHLTGIAAYTPTPAELAAIKAYVEAGGVLLIDNTGGSGAFADGMKAALKPVLGDTELTAIEKTSPLLTAVRPGMNDVTRAKLRPYTGELRGRARQLESATVGKGRILWTGLDLTSGLLGSHTWGIAGYDEDYASRFVHNAVFWAVDGKP